MVSVHTDTGTITEKYEKKKPHIHSDSCFGVCVCVFLFIQDGRLAAGDQLLSVDGRSLVGLSQER